MNQYLRSDFVNFPGSLNSVSGIVKDDSLSLSFSLSSVLAFDLETFALFLADPFFKTSRLCLSHSSQISGNCS